MFKNRRQILYTLPADCAYTAVAVSHTETGGDICNYDGERIGKCFLLFIVPGGIGFEGSDCSSPNRLKSVLVLLRSNSIFGHSHIQELVVTNKHETRTTRVTVDA